MMLFALLKKDFLIVKKYVLIMLVVIVRLCETFSVKVL